MEDWIQETCLISAVTSGPTEPKTFQEAWHYPVESERDNVTKKIWGLFLSSQPQEHLSRIQG